MLRGVVHAEPAAEHGQRASPGGETSAVRGRIDPPGKAAHHRDSPPAEVSTDAPGDLEARGGGPPGADQRHSRQLRQLPLAPEALHAQRGLELLEVGESRWPAGVRRLQEKAAHAARPRTWKASSTAP